MGGYREDRNWSDQHIPLVKNIVGPLLLEPANFERDALEATDLIVLKARDMRIAVRLRRPGYDRFKYQFTIRSMRDTGAETELSKILNGWGDWFFYGHAGDDMIRWMIVDLDIFRDTHENAVSGMQPNGDGTYFQWYDVRSFSPEILIAQENVL